MRVANTSRALHRKAMREYLLEVLEVHLKELERKGITLTITESEVTDGN